MEKEKLGKYKTQLTSLKNVIRKPICKVCFKEFTPKGFSSFAENYYICPSCKKLLIPIYHEYTIDDIKVFSIYHYEGPLSKWIYQYKESLDIELAPIFIDGLSLYLTVKFLFYNIVFMPSSKTAMKRRGFSSLKLMFKSLHLKVIEDILYKLDEIDQKTLNGKQRREHINFIGIRNINQIKGKNILLIDDVISTGTSIKEAIKMLKKGKPRRIKVLVLSENKKMSK